jgi:predicted dehydrogenase
MEQINRDVVAVGTGQYYFDLVIPTLKYLQNKGAVRKIIAVDINDMPENNPKDIPFYKRGQDESLSLAVARVSSDYSLDKPIVILGHANHLHTPDALDLLKNSPNAQILVEKPYCINNAQFKELSAAMAANKDKIGGLEYYLTMKAVPVELLFGLVKPNSLFHTEPGILKLHNGATIASLDGIFDEVIGKPTHITADVLEGEGNYKTVAHRNLSIVDTRYGGGMIQDLALHALSPLVAIQDTIGYLGDATKLKTAYCNEYVEMALEKGVPKEFIGESYAEFSYMSSKGVPIDVRVGKYILDEQNNRRIKIEGTRGSVIFDMTKNKLALQKGESVDGIVPLLEADKSGKVVPKYLAVLWSGIETLNGRNPFTFDTSDMSMKTQEYVLNLLVRTPDDIQYHKMNAIPDTIFKRQ